MTLKDFWESVKENIDTKVSNPFFGTLIFVLCWKYKYLLFSIFNFDSKTLLTDKVKIIQKYFDNLPLKGAQPFYKTEIMCSIYEAFLIIFLTYILITISKIIVEFFDKIITPQMLKIFSSASVKSKEEFDKVNEKLDKITKRFEEERNAKLSLQDEFDKLEKKMIQLSFSESNKKEEKTIQERASLFKKKLTQENIINDFKSIVATIKDNQPIAESSTNIRNYVTWGLLEKGSYSNSPNFYDYKILPLGNEVLNQITEEEFLDRSQN